MGGIGPLGKFPFLWGQKLVGTGEGSLPFEVAFVCIPGKYKFKVSHIFCE